MIKAGKLVFLLTFFAFMVQSLIFFSDNSDELLAIPLVLILGGIAAYFLGKDTDPEDAEFQTNIFLWAFSIRILVGLILYGWGLAELFGDEDASGYPAGWKVVQSWYTDGLDGVVSSVISLVFDRQNEGQALIWAIPTMFAGGPSRMIVSVTNSFFGAMLVVVVFRLTRRIFDAPTARIAAVLITVWSSIILLSASTQKEILVIFFEWLILYLLIRSRTGITVRDGVWAIPAFIAVFMIRFYALYLLAAAAIFRFIISKPEFLLRNIAFGAVIVASLMIFLTSSGLVQRDFDRIDRLNERVEDWRENVSASTGSGVEIYSEYESTSVAIPVATVYFFFAPFPWEAFSGSARNAFGAVENIFIIVIILLGFPAIKIFFKDKFIDMAPIFVFCVLYAGMHIWGLSNVGLAWRHKQTVMPLFFMLLAVAITQRRAGLALLTNRRRTERSSLSVIKAN